MTPGELLGHHRGSIPKAPAPHQAPQDLARPPQPLKEPGGRRGCRAWGRGPVVTVLLCHLQSLAGTPTCGESLL